MSDIRSRLAADEDVVFIRRASSGSRSRWPRRTNVAVHGDIVPGCLMVPARRLLRRCPRFGCVLVHEGVAGAKNGAARDGLCGRKRLGALKDTIGRRVSAAARIVIIADIVMHNSAVNIVSPRQSGRHAVVLTHSVDCGGYQLSLAGQNGVH